MVLVVAEHLELHGEVNASHGDIVRDHQNPRRKVQNRPDAGPDKLVGDALGRLSGRRNDPDGHVFLRDDGAKLGRRTDRQCANVCALLGRVAVQECDNSEAAGREAVVRRQRPAEVPDTDDHNRPILREAQLTGDLADQILDVVTDAASSVGAEVAQVFADFRGIDARQFCECFRGDRQLTVSEEFLQSTVVYRQASDTRIRYAPGRTGHATTLRRLCTRSQGLIRSFGQGAHDRAWVRLDKTGDAMTTALAAASALVAVAFAFSTYERWLLRRSPQYFAWTVALALFVVGASALAWGSSVGWSPLAFRIFYATGAVANVPVLAAGQMYLLVTRKTADRIAQVLGLVLAFTVGVVMTDPLTASVPADRLPKGDEVFHAWPRVFAAVGSGVGATVLVVGTVLGVVRIARANRYAQVSGARLRMTGLGLLALGTIVLGLSGLFNSVLNAMAAFSVTLMLGVTILFAGFVLSTTGPVGAKTPVKTH